MIPQDTGIFLAYTRAFRLNNIHKKLLDSDWLIAVQFKCNTSAKSETPMQITHRSSGL